MADLHVLLARQAAVGGVGAGPRRLPAVGAGQQRLQPGVGVHLGRVAALLLGGEQVARDVPGGDAVRAQQHQPQVHEVLAYARAALQQVGHRRADVGRALLVLEPGRDGLGQGRERLRRRVAADGGGQLVHRGTGGLVAGGQHELARGLAVLLAGQGLPRPVGRLGRLLVGHTGAGLDRQPLVTFDQVELDDLGTEVVDVGVQPCAGVDAQLERVHALVRGLGRADAQRVVLVEHHAVVPVLGEVTDRVLHDQPAFARVMPWPWK